MPHRPRPAKTTDDGTDGGSQRVERARARFAGVAFAESLGVTIRDVALDRAVLVLLYRPEHMNFSTVHVTTAVSGQLVAMGQISYRLLEPWPEGSSAGKGSGEGTRSVG